LLALSLFGLLLFYEVSSGSSFSIGWGNGLRVESGLVRFLEVA
jgi:hypothetical protein